MGGQAESTPGRLISTYCLHQSTHAFWEVEAIKSVWFWAIKKWQTTIEERMNCIPAQWEWLWCLTLLSAAYRYLSDSTTGQTLPNWVRYDHSTNTDTNMQKRTYRRLKYFMETQQLSQLEVFQRVLVENQCGAPTPWMKHTMKTFYCSIETAESRVNMLFAAATKKKKKYQVWHSNECDAFSLLKRHYKSRIGCQDLVAGMTWRGY